MKLNFIIKILLLAALLAALVWAGKWYLVDCRSGVRPMRVKLGRQFKLELDSNATTGYQWQLAQSLASRKVRQVDHKYITPKNGKIGAGGTEVWTFKAIGKGRTEIVFKYVRPWEKKVPPIELRTFFIDIR